MKNNNDTDILFNYTPDNNQVSEDKDDFESISDPFGGFDEIPESSTQEQSDYPENEDNIDEEVSKKVEILNSYQSGNLANPVPNQVVNNAAQMPNQEQKTENNSNNLNNMVNQEKKEPTFEDFNRVDQVFKMKGKSEKLGVLGLIITTLLFVGALIYSFIAQNDLVLTISVIAGGVLILVFLLIYFISSTKRKKFMSKNDINLVKNEMLSSDAIKIEKSKIYLTANYIVSYEAFPIILKYNDIAMLYNDKRTVTDGDNKINVGMSVVTILKSGEKLVILRTTNEQDLQFVIHTILERNSSIILGISEENKERLKKMQDFYKKVQNK